MNTADLSELYDKMLRAFSRDDVQEMCFRLGVDYDDIRGAKRDAKIRELIAGLSRSGRLNDLVALCAELRPNVDWGPALAGGGSQAGAPCVLFVTALRLEYEAVRAHLTALREEVHPAGTVYECGRFEGGGSAWRAWIVEAGMGNTGTALEVERAIAHCRPDVALFAGVAGGIKDVRLGDVVAATKVYAYESGKAEATFRPRPEVLRTAYALEQRARAEARKPDWRARIEGGAPEAAPEVFVGPIAAGEKVVASTQSAVYAFLRQQYGDALAVDMEGYGFLQALHAHPEVKALVVRGISDLIEGKAAADKAGSQQAAARHAAAFAFQVLLSGRPRPTLTAA